MATSERYEATRSLVVNGKHVQGGATFSAPPHAVAEAVAHGLVRPAPTPKRKPKGKAS